MHRIRLRAYHGPGVNAVYAPRTGSPDSHNAQSCQQHPYSHGVTLICEAAYGASATGGWIPRLADWGIHTQNNRPGVVQDRRGRHRSDRVDSDVGGTSIAGPPVILFFSNQGIKREVFRANLVAYFTFINIGAMIVFVLYGLLNQAVMVRTGIRKLII